MMYLEEPLVRIADIDEEKVHYDVCGADLDSYDTNIFELISEDKGYVDSINGVEQSRRYLVRTEVVKVGEHGDSEPFSCDVEIVLKKEEIESRNMIMDKVEDRIRHKGLIDDCTYQIEEIDLDSLHPNESKMLYFWRRKQRAIEDGRIDSGIQEGG